MHSSGQKKSCRNNFCIYNCKTLKRLKMQNLAFPYDYHKHTHTLTQCRVMRSVWAPEIKLSYSASVAFRAVT